MLTIDRSSVSPTNRNYPMPRRRAVVVKETVERLVSLAQRHSGSPLEKRVMVLRLIREAPSASSESIGIEVGVSKPTVDRWVALYRDGGLDQLLTIAKSGRRNVRRLDPKLVSRLVLMYNSGDLRSIEHAQEWLRKKLSIIYSRSGVALILRSNGARKPGRLSEQDVQSTDLFNLRARSALNALQRSFDAVQTAKSLEDLIMTLVSNVDKVTVILETRSDLLEPERYNPTALLMQSITGAEPAPLDAKWAPSDADASFSMKVYTDMRKREYPIHHYHEPIIFDLFYAGLVQIGAVFLWRSLRKPKLGNDAASAVNALRPFLEYVAANAVVWHQHRRPQEQVADAVLNEAVRRYSLTPQERAAATLQLLGYSYRQIAKSMNVTTETVKKHLSSVRRKSKTKSVIDLFATLFMPVYRDRERDQQ